jgi:hypothetical protein
MSDHTSGKNVGLKFEFSDQTLFLTFIKLISILAVLTQEYVIKETRGVDGSIQKQVMSKRQLSDDDGELNDGDEDTDESNYIEERYENLEGEESEESENESESSVEIENNLETPKVVEEITSTTVAPDAKSDADSQNVVNGKYSIRLTQNFSLHLFTVLILKSFEFNFEKNI